MYHSIPDPVMAVLMLEENGNLKSYLEDRRNIPQGIFAGMALGVAKAMAYLSELKVITLEKQCASVGNQGLGQRLNVASRK